MATRRQTETLTKSQIGKIRANLARRASRYGNLLADHIEGKQDLSNTQIKAAQILLGHVLPAQQAMSFTDETPQVEHQDVEAEYQKALEAIGPQSIKHALESMTDSERQLLLESIGKTDH